MRRSRSEWSVFDHTDHSLPANGPPRARAVANGQVRDVLYGTSGMLRLPVVLCVVRVANENTSPAPGGLSPRLLARAIALMREHDEESLDEIAAALHLSRGYFMRAFRAATGETPHRWRLRDRLDRAMTLLREPAASIADVAIACGFADQSHLTRLFVRQVGLGPGAWRRRVAGAHH